jgi:hypothetical protein
MAAMAGGEGWRRRVPPPRRAHPATPAHAQVLQRQALAVAVRREQQQARPGLHSAGGGILALLGGARSLGLRGLSLACLSPWRRLPSVARSRAAPCGSP